MRLSISVLIRIISQFFKSVNLHSENATSTDFFKPFCHESSCLASDEQRVTK